MKKPFILFLLPFYLFAVVSPIFAQSAVLTATVHINPLEVEVTAPSTVKVGEWFEISADISNPGMERISRTFAVLSAHPDLNIRGKEKKNLGSLPAGATKTVKWRARVDSTENYIVIVEAKGNLAGQEISASGTTTIPVFVAVLTRFFRLIFGLGMIDSIQFSS